MVVSKYFCRSLFQKTRFLPLVIFTFTVAFPLLLQAKMVLEGDATDINKFNDLVEKAKAKSENFKNLMDQIDGSDQTLTIKLVRNQRGVILYQFQREGSQIIDLDDIEKFPDSVTSTFGSSAYYEKLAFILAAGFHAVVTGESYIKCYEVGLSSQSKVRDDFGQREDAKYAVLVKHDKHWHGVTKYFGIVLSPDPYNGRKEILHLTREGQITGIEYIRL